MVAEAEADTERLMDFWSRISPLNCLPTETRGHFRAAQKEMLLAVRSLVDEAIQGGHLDHAGRLAAISVSAAQRAKNPTLIRDAQEAKRKVDEMAGKAAAEGGKKKGK